MFECVDKNGINVQLQFKSNGFPFMPSHVLAIPTYNGRWLLTKHRKRGIEFPGGKVEKGETLADAIKREVYEETGGIIHQLRFIGEYYVKDPSKPFVKAVYQAEIKELEEKENYMETNGPILLSDVSQLDDPIFSFMMRDEIMEKLIEYVIEHR